jgi:hypothetical protein
MRVAELKELIKDKPDDEQIIVFCYDKAEANDHIWNAFERGEEQPEITNEEWNTIAGAMTKDEAIWQEMSETFSWHMDKLEETRKKKS